MPVPCGRSSNGRTVDCGSTNGGSIPFLPPTCGYDVVVTYDLAKVGSRVRIPLAALLKTGQQLFFLIEDHEVPGSIPGLGTCPISSIGRARI